MSIKALKPLEATTDPSANQETNSSAQPISTDALLTLIASMQQQLLASQQANADANARLAEAILKTTEPREYVKTTKELAVEANEELFKKNEKELERRKKANKEAEQTYCEHIAGCSQLGDEKDLRGRTSILWHRNDV